MINEILQSAHLVIDTLFFGKHLKVVKVTLAITLLHPGEYN